jgi:hypothetical protein
LFILNNLFKITDMLFSTTTKLEDLVVEALFNGPQQSAKAIHREVSRKNGPCSLQAIYQELRKLSRGGVVIHVDGRYSLRTGWILGITSKIDRMRQGYLSSEGIRAELLEQRDKLRWRFPHLYGLVSFWSMLMFTLLTEKDQRCFEWVPHIWFHLIETDEHSFVSHLRDESLEYYLVSGGNTYVDRQYRRFLPKELGDLAWGHTIDNHMGGKHFTVFGEYLITVKLDPSLEEKISNTYHSIRRASDIRPAELTQLVHYPGAIQLQLEHSPRKSKRIQRKFERFFGLT